MSAPCYQKGPEPSGTADRQLDLWGKELGEPVLDMRSSPLKGWGHNKEGHQKKEKVRRAASPDAGKGAATVVIPEQFTILHGSDHFLQGAHPSGARTDEEPMARTSLCATGVHYVIFSTILRMESEKKSGSS